MSGLIKTTLHFGLAVAVACALVAPLQAANQPAANLDQVLGELADHIVKYLNKHQAQSVSVGAFTGNPSQGATGGTGIAEALRQKLVDRKIEVAVGSPFGLRGRFMGRKQPDNDLFAVHILVSLVDQNDAELVTYPVVVYDLADMSKLLGVTASLPVKDDKPIPPSGAQTASANRPAQRPSQTSDPTLPAGAERSQASPPITATAPQPADAATAILVARHDALAVSNLRPEAKLSPGGGGLPTEISPDAKSPYAVEIFVRGTDGKFQPRPAVPVNGKPFVAIAPGETYQVRLINRSKYDAGVALSIDGLSSFAFSDNAGYRRLDKWVVPADGVAVVPGWHRGEAGGGQTKFDEFTVTGYAKTAAAELGNAEQIGTMTVMFCAAWRPDQPPPPDELRKLPTLRGTGRGKEVLAAVSEVHRHFGQIRAIVSIRYEKTEPPDLPAGEMLMAAAGGSQ